MTRTISTDLHAADELGRQLSRFGRTMHRIKQQLTLLGPDGVEPAAYPILFCLVNQGPQRTSTLADALFVEVSTVSRQVSNLVQHGLVRREADPQDGRATLLAATDEGIDVFEQHRRRRNEWLAGVIADWADHDRQALTSLLDRLNNSIETHEGNRP